MKKFIVIPFGYEYNDSTYDRDGFLLEDSKHFDTVEEANKVRKELTKERITELNDDYNSVLYCVPDATRKK